MKTVDPAMEGFSRSLEETLRAAKAARLRDYLLGGFLPAVGGDLGPVEILLRGLALSRDSSTLAKSCARLLARVFSDEVHDLNASSEIPPDRKALLLNALRLAAELPAQADLSRAIWEVRGSLRRHHDLDQYLLPILNALIFQQVNDSLEGLWFRYLEALHGLGRPWRPSEYDFLFLAWRGLLWIPPSSQQREVIHFDRIDRGLRAVCRAVATQKDGSQMLRFALDILTESYPRSGEFWTARLSPLFPGWPAELKREAGRKWPGLVQASSSNNPHNEPVPRVAAPAH